MHLLIFGASGRTGREIISQALTNGYEVTAVVRDPSRLERRHERLHLLTGDARSAADVENIFANQGGYEAVICALGGSSKDTGVRAEGTRHITEAMCRHLPQGVRLWVVSSVGVGDSRGQLPLAVRMTLPLLLRRVFADHQRQEEAVQASGLDFTVVRPTGLSDGCRSGDYEVKAEGPLRSSSIKRADVADFILTNLSNPAYSRKAVSITG